MTRNGLIGLALLALTLSACAPRPYRPEGPPPEGYGVMPDIPRDADPDEFPRSPEEISGPAVLALLQQAAQERRYGRPQQASAILERALRIEPRNPFVWQALAAAHLDQNRPDKAEPEALKSNSLARGNPHIEGENWRVIAAARAARGDMDGALRAQERADRIAEKLD